MDTLIKIPGPAFSCLPRDLELESLGYLKEKLILIVGLADANRTQQNQQDKPDYRQHGKHKENQPIASGYIKCPIFSNSSGIVANTPGSL